jgi:hypothetical protein
MGTKPTLVLQPCPEVAIQIDPAIAAIEAVGRSDWDLKESCLNTLVQPFG